MGQLTAFVLTYVLFLDEKLDYSLEVTTMQPQRRSTDVVGRHKGENNDGYEGLRDDKNGFDECQEDW